jgi:hypothetical protein
MTKKQISEKMYRLKNKEKIRNYQKLYQRERRRHQKEYYLPQCHPDTDVVLKSIPNPFGTFEKAKYILCKGETPIYFFTTTCRNMEDCIELMQQKFNILYSSNNCYIYKLKNGIKDLIFSAAESKINESICKPELN